MEKPECVSDYEKHDLEMSDQKCDKCPYLYECRFMLMAINEVISGDDEF